MSELNYNEHNTQVNNTKGTSNPWIPVIMGLAGAVIGWFLSGLVGLVLGVGGFATALKQKKETNQVTAPLVISGVLAVVTVIFYIMAMLA